MNFKNSFIQIFLLFAGVSLLGLGYYLGDTHGDSQVKGVATEEVGVSSSAVVVDGDTIVLENDERVRLIGINSPERGQPYFDEAKETLEKLLVTPEVKLTTDVQGRDNYGRTLAYVFTKEGLDVNLEMVKRGMAVVETVPPNVSKADLFAQAQVEARNNCVGIWEGLCSNSESACIQISEIRAKATSGNKNDEWIEFTNTCSTPQSLSGYLLKDSSASNSYLFGEASIHPKKSIKLHSGCGQNSDTSLYWTCPEGNYIWNDNGDRAYLYNTSGKLVSELGY